MKIEEYLKIKDPVAWITENNFFFILLGVCFMDIKNALLLKPGDRVFVNSSTWAGTESSEVGRNLTVSSDFNSNLETIHKNHQGDFIYVLCSNKEFWPSTRLSRGFYVKR